MKKKRVQKEGPKRGSKRHNMVEFFVRIFKIQWGKKSSCKWLRSCNVIVQVYFHQDCNSNEESVWRTVLQAFAAITEHTGLVKLQKIVICGQICQSIHSFIWATHICSWRKPVCNRGLGLKKRYDWQWQYCTVWLEFPVHRLCEWLFENQSCSKTEKMLT